MCEFTRATTLPAKEPGAASRFGGALATSIEGNKIADEWAKQAANEPDAHGVEWLDFKDPDGILRMRRFPLPR